MKPLILLVDDELEFTNTLSERLQMRGFETVVAATGVEALSAIAENPPQLALIDLKMPEMNGLELLKHIRTQSPQTPVILLSGRGTTTDGIQSMRLGAVDFLTKPVDIDSLVSCIQKNLP